MTDEQLVAGSQSNRAACQQLLYQQYSAKMMGVCYRFAKHQSDAEDMLQEGFIRVFSQLHQFRGEGSLEAWIRKIIVHTCINIIKKNKKFNESVDISSASHLHTHPDHFHAIMQAKKIVECIRMLPLGYRTVLNLFAIEGYSHKEIALMLDIEEGSSRSQYARAKMMLEKILISKHLLEGAYLKNNLRKTAS